MMAVGLLLLLSPTLPLAAQEVSDSWAVRFADSILQQWPQMDDMTHSWCYEAGIVLHGIQQVYHLTGDSRYFAYIKDFADSYVDSNGSVSYSTSTLDDYLPARQLLFLFEETGEARYLLAAEGCRNTLETINRNASGGFWHKDRYPHQMWCDGQYMALPFLIQYGLVTDNNDYPALETHRQISLLAAHAQAANGLLYHGWDESYNAAWADPVTGLSPEFWGRGLGWFAMALVDILDYFPAADPRGNEILAILQNLIPGLASVQDPATGLWYQVLDKGQLSDNWLESSASAMFVYTVHKAARRGYVDAAYLTVAEQGWNGLLEHKITEEPNGYIGLRDIAIGMGIQSNYQGYVRVSRLSNSPHGLGAFLLAATEMLKTGPGETPAPTPQFAPGDVNSDGMVTIIDALLVAQYYVGLNPPNFNPAVADVNCDGRITILDALLVAQYYVGLIAAFPCSPPPTPTPPAGDALYAAPYGSASAAGTESDPLTFDAALSRVGPGQTIYLRGGTYNYSATITIEEGNSGTSTQRKNISAYTGETPVLNFSALAEDSSNRGLQIFGSYWYVKGIVVEEAGDNGIFIGGNNNTLERCITRRNHDTGLQLGRISSSYASISRWPSNNIILQCESYDNADSDAEDADGFAAKLTTGTGNVFRGCISHHNIDDGWDLYTKTETGPIGPVTLEYCIAYNNGTLTDGSTSGNGDKNGFKLGGEDIAVNHTVRYCIAFGNGKHGFTYNRNLGTIDFRNNTACYSAERNFNFDGGTSIFTNNLSLVSGDTDRIIGSILNPDYNCWWNDNGSTINPRGLVVTTADFVSLSIGTFGFNPDGTLAYGNFLKLASGSDLPGAGMSGENIGAN